MDTEQKAKPRSTASPIFGEGDEPKQRNTEQPKEQCRRVRFHEKRHDYEEDRVKLIVNGEMIVLARAVEVVLPDRYLEAARHACHPVFKQVPGVDRKVSAPIATFPFDDLGPGEWEDFYRMRKEGTDKIRKEIEPKPV